MINKKILRTPNAISGLWLFICVIKDSHALLALSSRCQLRKNSWHNNEHQTRAFQRRPSFFLRELIRRPADTLEESDLSSRIRYNAFMETPNMLKVTKVVETSLQELFLDAEKMDFEWSREGNVKQWAADSKKALVVKYVDTTWRAFSRVDALRSEIYPDASGSISRLSTWESMMGVTSRQINLVGRCLEEKDKNTDYGLLGVAFYQLLETELIGLKEEEVDKKPLAWYYEWTGDEQMVDSLDSLNRLDDIEVEHLWYRVRMIEHLVEEFLAQPFVYMGMLSYELLTLVAQGQLEEYLDTFGAKDENPVLMTDPLLMVGPLEENTEVKKDVYAAALKLLTKWGSFAALLGFFFYVLFWATVVWAASTVASAVFPHGFDSIFTTGGFNSNDRATEQLLRYWKN